jgi:class 3 adenylate cyclase/tetratricopeptide (TPR) repeat protein
MSQPRHEQPPPDGRTPAVVLFVDISGFTVVTETIMQQDREAAEVLAEVMRGIFSPLVEAVNQRGGFVATFAGDAFTAVFPIPLTARSPQTTVNQALAAAWHIKEWIAAQPVQTTPYGSFTFAAKQGMAIGDLNWQQVATNDPDTRPVPRHYYSGSAVIDATTAETHAQPGQLLITTAVADHLQDHVQMQPHGDFWRVTGVADPVFQTPVANTPPPLIPQPTSSQLDETRGEFRQVVTLFLNVRRPEQLTTVLRELAHYQTQYGGYLAHIGLDDKGINLLLFWGMPTTYENDTERALMLAHHLRQALPRSIRAGLTYRLVYAGLVGGAQQETYTGYGHGINLAARFMMAAPWGELWLDEELAQRANRTFNLQPIGYLSFKGVATEQPVFALRGRRNRPPVAPAPGQLVGRTAELDALAHFVAPLQDGRFAGTLLITGEAGVGKSHLARAFFGRWQDQSGGTVFVCPANTTNRQPFNPFRLWLRSYFGQANDRSPERNLARFNRQMDQLLAHAQTEETDHQPNADLVQQLDRTRSVLAALLNLHWPNSLYDQLDPQGRFDNTLTALKSLILLESRRQSLILYLEDAHLLDGESRQALRFLVRNLIGYPLAIIATGRPSLPADGFGLDVPYRAIELGPLDPTLLPDLAHAILDAPIAPDLQQLLARRCEGNPFFAEQILLYLREQALLVQDKQGRLTAAELPAHTLPADVRTLLMARLDQLPTGVRELVQMAAVLGRAFDVPLLSALVAEAGGSTAVVPEEIPHYIQAATEAGIWAEPAADPHRYLFAQALLRDAAYAMQSRTRRRLLHTLAAQTIEHLHAADLSPHYATLAYHTQFAEQSDAAWRWHWLAGQQAAAEYANQTAVTHFSQALSLLPAEAREQRYDLLLAREQVHELQGNRAAQAEDLTELAGVIDGEGAPLTRQTAVLLRQAHLANATDRYKQGITLARSAIDLAQKAGLIDVEAHGYWCWSSALSHQGQHGAAHEMGQKALHLARQAAKSQLEEQILRSLGRYCLFLGTYEQAEAYYQAALAMNQASGNRRFEADALNGLGSSQWLRGRFADAQRYYEASMAIRQMIGDGPGLAIALQNMALVTNTAGDYYQSWQYHQQALAVCREVGSRRGEAATLGNMAVVMDRLGLLAETRPLYEESIRIRQEIGDRTGEAESRGNFSYHLVRVGQPDLACEQAAQAVALIEAAAAPHGAAYHLRMSGYALESRGDWAAAQQAYEQAIAIWQDLAQQELPLEAVAGLVRLCLREGNADEALALTEQIWPYLDGRSGHGWFAPSRVYVTAYEAFMFVGDERAEKVLASTGLCYDRHKSGGLKIAGNPPSPKLAREKRDWNSLPDEG